MSSPDGSQSDFVDDLLAPAPPPGDDSLRRVVLARTTALIHRRRQAKRAGWVLALAACYLAGMATARPWRSSAKPVAKSASTEEAVSQEPADRPLATPGPRRTATAGREKPRLTGAKDGPLVRKPAGYDQIRRVADRYLLDEGDIALATRYYGRALKLASADQRAISIENDSWLLMALKHARNGETHNDDDGS